MIVDQGTASEVKRSRERISRIRRRLQEEIPLISIERALHFTASWKETEGEGLAPSIRVALAMNRVFERMTICLDDDDRLAGHWTETFLGIPIDVERGLWNDVLAVELSRRALIVHQVKSSTRFLRYMIANHGLSGLVRTIRTARRDGMSPPVGGFATMDRRQRNRFRIGPRERKTLLEEILPYWRGKTVADRFSSGLLSSGLMSVKVRDFIRALVSTPSKQTTILSPAAVIGTYQGHLIQDFEPVLAKGLLAMRDEVIERIESGDAADDETMNFLRSVKLALDGIILYARRLAAAVEDKAAGAGNPSSKAELEAMAAICAKVPLEPSESIDEAMQAYWTVKVATELANPQNVHSLGRLDQLFYPYYRNDVEAGRFDRESTIERFGEMLLKSMVHTTRPESNLISDYYQRYEGSTPATIGGLTRDGHDATNELTYLVLEAAQSARSVTSVVVRLHEGSPDALTLAVSEGYFHGACNVTVMNDAIGVDAMTKRGFSVADARDYAITGCVDLIPPGRTAGIGFSALLLCRVLDITLRNGDCQTLIGPVADVGIRTGTPETFETFEELVDAFIAQARHIMGAIVEASNLRDRLFAEYQPAPFVSAFMDGCLESGRDVTRSGTDYDLTGILFINSIANVVDSLHVIRTCVFEKRLFTLDEMITAIDDNFVGHEDLYEKIRQVRGKWGNGDPEIDRLARSITTRLFRETYGFRTYRKGPVVPFVNSMTSHTMDGRLSIATPDGRKAGRPYAASCNPYNVDRSGLTGVLTSVAALDYDEVLGCAVNIKLHPSAIGRTSRTQAKWAALVRTYFDMGGAQLQPTVVSAERLRGAREAPDENRDIIVKVGGYSAYFVDLGREIQDEIISRTEHTA